MTAGIAAFAARFVVFKIYKQHMGEIRQTTEESANAYKNTASSIYDYADTASSYFTASNAAYDLKENVEELTSILDGQNFIAGNAAISMDDMALATSEAAASAARYGVQIDELSALIAAATSITHGSGSDTGSALNTLFDNLQDTANGSVRKALDAVNISMTETVNGSEKLKTPI